MQVLERTIDRTELYAASEIFACGSGMEVIPFVTIDKLSVGDGNMGPITRAIQQTYFKIARGEDKSYPEWRIPVYS